jgi:hypothetical protein
MAWALIVTGLPAAGKSDAGAVLAAQLRADGYLVSVRSDKQALEDQVWLDIRAHGRPGPAPGSLAGRHSVLLNPGAPPGTLKMLFRDGNALNSAHRALLADVADLIRNADDRHVVLVEWAYGADYPYEGEPLLQSATHLVRWLRETGVLPRVWLLEIVASYVERERRNGTRPDGVPPGEFARHFREEGHLSPADQRAFGGRCVRVSNTDVPEEVFRRRIAGVYHSLLREWLSGRTERERARMSP